MNDVLAFSRVSRQPLELKTLATERLLQSVMQECPELQAAEVDIESPLLPLQGDESSLTQCLSNLLSNAAKFVAPGVKARVRIYTEANGPRVRLYVQDNGIGIDAREQATVRPVPEAPE